MGLWEIAKVDMRYERGFLRSKVAKISSISPFPFSGQWFSHFNDLTTNFRGLFLVLDWNPCSFWPPKSISSFILGIGRFVFLVRTVFNTFLALFWISQCTKCMNFCSVRPHRYFLFLAYFSKIKNLEWGGSDLYIANKLKWKNVKKKTLPPGNIWAGAAPYWTP